MYQLQRTKEKNKGGKVLLRALSGITAAASLAAFSSTGALAATKNTKTVATQNTSTKQQAINQYNLEILTQKENWYKAYFNGDLTSMKKAEDRCTVLRSLGATTGITGITDVDKKYDFDVKLLNIKIKYWQGKILKKDDVVTAAQNDAKNLKNTGKSIFAQDYESIIEKKYRNAFETDIIPDGLSLDINNNWTKYSAQLNKQLLAERNNIKYITYPSGLKLKDEKDAILDPQVPTGFVTVSKDNINTKLSQSFALGEFYTDRSRDGNAKQMNNSVHIKINPKLVEKLETFRYNLSKTIGTNNISISIVSGYRSPQYNEILRAKDPLHVAKFSQHLNGNAVDVEVYNKDKKAFVSWSVLANVANQTGFGGVGVYDGNFIHVDVRDGKERWDYGSRTTNFWTGQKNVLSNRGGIDRGEY